MSKIAVLAENSSMGHNIARILDCTKKGNGYLEGSNYVVIWAKGHLVKLTDPLTDNRALGLADLPLIPENLGFEVIEQTKEQFEVVKKQLNREDVEEVIVATSAGHEGELSARGIITKAGVNKPINRLLISSVTDKAIREGINEVSSDEDYEDIYNSAVTRSMADWYVETNVTHALKAKYDTDLFIDRVQIPTLALVAAREGEIEQFKEEEFFGIEARTKDDLILTWQDSESSKRIFSEARADALVGRLDNTKAIVESFEKEQVKLAAPQLYDLTTLQWEANQLLSYSAKETLTIMQSLYEEHKILTYPLTDSRIITPHIVSTLKERLEVCNFGEYAKHVTKIMEGEFELPKTVVNDIDGSDHHAIIPTDQSVSLDKLTESEREIYDLVVKRFLAVLSDPYEYEHVRVIAEIDNAPFVASEKTKKSLGWKEIYNGSSNKQAEVTDDFFATIEEGDIIKDLEISLTSGKTEQPIRLTEGSLLQAMVNPARILRPDEEAPTNKTNKFGGLGTAATRTLIIEGLLNRTYIEKKGNDIYLTSKGAQLLKLVPENLRSPDLAIEWEEKLNLIANGKLSKSRFITDLEKYTEELVEEIKKSEITVS